VTKQTIASSVVILAPAKINLILRILDRRPDGYHNLWSVMQTVALEDQLRISSIDQAHGIQLSCDSAALAADPSNLVYRAAVAVMDRAQRPIGLDIELKKRIPMGAGLGGGSSDAAATIIGLNRLLGLGWSQAEMAQVGQPLGSDVPFFLYAPTAAVGGRGERVEALSLEGNKWVLLVNPGFGVETKWAYQELAATRKGVLPLSSTHQAIDQHRRVSWPQLAQSAANDFEPPVFAKYGILAEIKETLVKQGAEIALLSGSGATVFGLFGTEASARHAQVSFYGNHLYKTFVVPTCSGSLVAS
jgi:4-diphosphocytidyl-2-C-methyl-D-erythritol kinase